MAVQVAQVAVGGVAMANIDDHMPFSRKVTYDGRMSPSALEELDERLALADCGDAESQYWMASALYGFNSSPDKVEIYKWYRLAELSGFDSAVDRRVAVQDAMSAEELAQARARTDAWAPRTEGCSSDQAPHAASG